MTARGISAQVARLGREKRELEEENAAMRELLQVMVQRSWYTHSSTLGGPLVYSACCPFEECERETTGDSRDIPHTPTCPVTKARELLRKSSEEVQR